jgi:hypothetical protein
MKSYRRRFLAVLCVAAMQLSGAKRNGQYRVYMLRHPPRNFSPRKLWNPRRVWYYGICQTTNAGPVESDPDTGPAAGRQPWADLRVHPLRTTYAKKLECRGHAQQ